MSENDSTSIELGGTPFPYKQVDMSALEEMARDLRRDILNMIALAGSGHPGGSLSAVEILLSLYVKVMKHNPSDPGMATRDRFILSKAHACPVLYTTLAYCGYFERDHLWSFRKINSLLQGHAHIMTPGVEMSGGSLGQGLSFGIGAAIGERLSGSESRTYVLLGDGECDEGQVWEAAMAASHYQVDNLVAIVDRNRIQNDRFTEEVMNLEPLAEKWSSFGWHTINANGHDFQEVLNALEQANNVKGKPTVIIANTIKGKGISFMENNPDFHGKAPTPDQLEKALLELDLK